MHDAVFLFTVLTVILVLPFLKPVTFPFWVTFAILGLPDRQISFLFLAETPFLGFTVAFSRMLFLLFVRTRRNARINSVLVILQYTISFMENV